MCDVQILKAYPKRLCYLFTSITNCVEYFADSINQMLFYFIYYFLITLTLG